MMVTPAARDGEVQFVPTRTLKGPPIVLDRTLKHVQRMGSADGLILVDHCHLGDSSARATQNEAVATEPDTRFCRETRVPEGPPQARPSIPQVSNDAPAEAVPSRVPGRRPFKCGNSCFKPFVLPA